jgi:hypothetical protein
MPVLENVLVPLEPLYSTSPVNITLTNGKIESITPCEDGTEPPSLLVPALCHPHIHLDKAYILTSHPHPSVTPDCHADLPSYSDLEPKTGSFSEALQNTSLAKSRYTRADLHLRGEQLLADSLSYGVTCARAFVEVDHVTGTIALEVGIELKRRFAAPGLDVQLCAFAQDPVFSTEHGEANRRILESALRDPAFKGKIAVLGATPYVEKSLEAAVQNINWAVQTALELNLHLDFHLDYNLEDPGEVRPMVYDVIDALVKHGWPTYESNSGREEVKTVVLGHCSQLTRLSNAEMTTLASRIKSAKLPIHLVGLPTSDIFMMGRPNADTSCCGSRLRGTLQVPSLIKDHGLNACLGVNNVGNAFTPFGTGDPLSLASWGVGLYHAGTVVDAELLYGSVSYLARQAIGCAPHGEEDDEGEQKGQHSMIRIGKNWRPMLMVRNQKLVEVVGPSQASARERTFTVPAKQWLSVKDVVWDPPGRSRRSLI